MWTVFYAALVVVPLTTLSLEFKEEPIETIALLNQSTQINCSFTGRTTESGKWYIHETLGFRLLAADPTVYDSNYEVNFTDIGDQYTFNLHIPYVTANMEFSHECRSTASLRKTVPLHVVGESPTYDVSPSSRVVTGNAITITCTMTKAVPPGDLVILMDNDILASVNQTSTTLVTRGVGKENNGSVVTCCLLYETLPPPEDKQLNCAEETVMIVEYPPVVNITSESDNFAIEGNDFIAECVITEEGQPRQIDHWYWVGPNDVIFNGKYIRLPSISRSQSATYTCYASNTYHDGTNGTGTARIEVIVQYPPVVQINVTYSSTILEGMDFQSKCYVTDDGYPPVVDNLFWELPDGNQYTGQFLHLVSLSRMDVGRYTCVARNTYHDDTNGIAIAYQELDVQYYPNITILEESDGKVIRGQDYQARCDVDANPSADVVWDFSNDNVMIDTPLLAISNVDLQHSGNYTCIANNTVFTGDHGTATESLYLDVQYLNKPTIDDSSSAKVIEGQQYYAMCSAESNPRHDIYWSLRGEATLYNGLLDIRVANRNDSGTYTCIVNTTFWNEESENKSSAIFLDVEYVSEPIIYDVTDGKVIEGESYYANCSTDTNPVGRTFWTSPQGVETDNDDLEIIGSSRGDSGNYVCTTNTTYWNGQHAITNTTVYVDVQYQPYVDIVDNSNGRVIVNQPYTAYCRVDANPAADITWEDDTGNVNTQDTELVINNAQRHHAGIYTCRANNTFYNGDLGLGEAFVILDVQYISIPVIYYKNNGKVIEGLPYYANCSTDANPNANLYWSYPGGRVTLRHDIDIAYSDKTDSGTYICMANTTFWDGDRGSQSSELYIDVQYEPYVSIDDDSNGKVIIGQPYQATCNVDANPRANITWENIDDNFRVHDTILAIQNATLDNAGNYTCKAKNQMYTGDIRQGEDTITLDVQYIMKPVIYDGLNKGKVIEGQQYYATCIAEANPVSEISWLLPSGETQHTYELTVTEAGRSNVGVYTCNANTTYWNNDTEIKSSTVELDVQYISDPTIYDGNRYGKVIKGRRYYANCSADSNPVSGISWLSPDGNTIHSHELDIIVTDRGDSGVYICRANTSFWNGQEENKTSIVVLDVQYLSDPEIDDVTNGKVIEGHNYYANCVAQSNPTVDVYWLSPSREEINSPSLNITNSDRSDSGIYTCYANTTYWTDEPEVKSSVITLDVQYISYPYIYDISNGKVIEGQPYYSNCSSDSNPDGDIYWQLPSGLKSYSQEVILSVAMRNDSGEYACTTNNTYWNGDPGIKTSILNLDVQYLSDPEIGDVTNGKVIEGHNYYANCVAQSNPTADVYWLSPSREKINSPSLNITNSDRSDSGTYTCYANTTYWTDQPEVKSSGITIDVQYTSYPYIYDISNGKVIEGQPYYSNCSSDSNPDGDIYWQLPSGLKSYSQEVILSVAMRSDSGEYACTTNNTYWNGDPGIKTSILNLDVQYLSDPEIGDVTNGKVIEGHNYYANCVAQSNPTADVYWLSPSREEINSPSLNITNSDRSDSGTYTCYANTTYWTDQPEIKSSGITLDVQYPPEGMDNNVFSKEGEEVQLSCGVVSNPLPFEYKWTEGMKQISTDETYTIQEVDRSDAGQYTCTATNKYHDNTEGTGHTITTLTVQYNPNVTIEVSETIIEGDDLNIKCKAVDGTLSRLVLYFKNELLKETTGRAIDHTVKDINRSDDGIYECRTITTFYDGSEGLASDMKDVTVQYASSVKITFTPSSDMVEGDKVDIGCDAMGGEPSPYKLTLTYNQKVISEEKETPLQHTIDKIDRSQSGTYTCVAVTQFYDDSEMESTDSGDIVVQYPPTITDDSKTQTEFIVKKDEEIQMKCGADAVPIATITWYYENSIISGNEANRKIEELPPVGSTVSSILKVVVADDSYYGTYTCVADNKLAPTDNHTIDIIKSDDNIIDSIKIAVIAGGALLLLTIIIAIALCVRHHNQMRKRDQYKLDDKANKNASASGLKKGEPPGGMEMGTVNNGFPKDTGEKR
ncbi:basement membrane-specific heparan sulfate proteoglycan core protein-like [Glandiceps talaboti]